MTGFMKINGDDVVSEPTAVPIAEFAALWGAKCAPGELPIRGDFPMEVLRPWIGNLLLMDVLDEGRDFRYRLVGTDLVEIVGRDLTGKVVSECEYDGGTEHVLSSFRKPVEMRGPVFRRGKVIWRSRKSYLDYESVHCPIQDADGAIVMTIGAQVYKDPFAAG